jgi:hypothetical protein
MKLGKAAGHDQTTPEMIKYMGKTAEELLLRILQKAWNEKKTVKHWEVAIIIPIFKKGSNKECKNHRGISLLSVPGKIYSRILKTRQRQEMEHKLDETQNGFRPGRSVQIIYFTLRQEIEKVIAYGRELCLCFIDLEKAFDRIPWQELWKVLKENNVNKGLVETIQSFYKKCRCYVRTGNNKSEEFIVTAEVKQGDILPPYLFIILMDDVFKQIKLKMKKYQIGCWKMKPINISDLVYVDDIVLFAMSQANMQRNLEILNSELLTRNMLTNHGKTKIMMIGRSKKSCIVKLMGKDLERVENFKYLGGIINEKGKIEEEINTRTLNAGNLYHVINKGFFRKERDKSKNKNGNIQFNIYSNTIIWE